MSYSMGDVMMSQSVLSVVTMYSMGDVMMSQSVLSVVTMLCHVIFYPNSSITNIYSISSNKHMLLDDRTNKCMLDVKSDTHNV